MGKNLFSQAGRYDFLIAPGFSNPFHSRFPRRFRCGTEIAPTDLVKSKLPDYLFKLHRALGQKLLEMHASQQASAKETEAVSCPKCEKACRSWRKRERQLTTLCGDIRVERWVYHCDAKHYHTPLDTKQQFKGRYTSRVTEVMCRFAANFDYRSAAEELVRQGIDVNHTTLHKKVREWTKDLRALEQVECQTLAPYERWYVSTDGCHTNSLEGWKETKVSCVYRDYPQLGPIVSPEHALKVSVILPIFRMLLSVDRIYMC